jgi:alkanesulfonate monooxygenase SsuD/methylene tetrahydromethanopterin reductase-like flavin-dependent oxidoreductase (luciferase family)
MQGAFLSQLPKQKPLPPVYVGAFASKDALEVAGRFGDGWYPWLNTPDTFRKRWAVVKEAAKSAGRSVEQIDPVAQVLVAFPRNAEEKRDVLTRAKATLIVEKTLLKTLGHAPKTNQYQNLVHISRENSAKIMDAAKAVPDEIVYQIMAVGGPSEAIEKIDGLARAGARQVAIFDLLGLKALKRTVKLFRKIMSNYNQ